MQKTPSMSLLFGLAPGGVCRAILVAKNAGRSYRTVSPLPSLKVSLKRGRFIFCDTFPRVSPAGRYPAPFFCGARTFLTFKEFLRFKNAIAWIPSSSTSHYGGGGEGLSRAALTEFGGSAILVALTGEKKMAYTKKKVS